MTETIKYKGREWEVKSETQWNNGDVGLLLEVPNRMPELSVGDWYRLTDDSLILCDYPKYAPLEDIVEIRFADGRPTWKRT